MIDVLTPGPFTTVQDSGRVGWAHLGVPVGASLQVDDEPAPTGRTVLVPAGSRVTVGGTDDVRAYLAVAGGIDVAPVLGSRSADTLSGLGPGPLSQGDVLAVAPADLPPVWVLDRCG